MSMPEFPENLYNKIKDLATKMKNRQLSRDQFQGEAETLETESVSLGLYPGFVSETFLTVAMVLTVADLAERIATTEVRNHGEI